jgi:hypothetical protein
LCRASLRRLAGLTVQPLTLPPMTAPLSHCDLLLDAAVELSCHELIPVTGGGRVFKPEINPDRCIDRHGGREDDLLHCNTQPPIPDGILGEAAGFEMGILQTLFLEDTKRIARKSY